MRVGLFVTCLVDLLRPRIGFSAIKLLEAAGCEVVVPAAQTCCGQPGYNSGDRRSALVLAKKLLAEFADCDYLVAPSGSCAGMIRVHYAELAKDEPELTEPMASLSAKTFELSEFLVDIAKLDRVPGDFQGRVTYHDACAGLRELGVQSQPRALLAKMPGVSLTEMPTAEECCGFGGTFAFKFGEISAAIAEKKCVDIQATTADAVALGDLGCMLNIEGKLRRMGDEKTQVLHIAELLAGNL